jgi:hypothetical protein
MMKHFILMAFTLFSVSSFAQQQCATNITELKALVGNSDVSLQWKETSKSNPLTLRLSNGGGALRLKLTNQRGDWADVTGVVCKKGTDSYVAKVSNIVWGPAAPEMVKSANIKNINLKLPYQSVLKVSVSVFSFNFSPL